MSSGLLSALVTTCVPLQHSCIPLQPSVRCAGTVIIENMIRKSKGRSRTGVLRHVKQYVGKTGSMNLAGLEFEVVVKDYKNSWGRDRFLVTPKSGGGEKWAENVQFSRSA